MTIFKRKKKRNKFVCRFQNRSYPGTSYTAYQFWKRCEQNIADLTIRKINCLIPQSFLPSVIVVSCLCNTLMLDKDILLLFATLCTFISFTNWNSLHQCLRLNIIAYRSSKWMPHTHFDIHACSTPAWLTCKTVQTNWAQFWSLTAAEFTSPNPEHVSNQALWILFLGTEI